MRFRDRDGRRRLESTHTEDWQEAQRSLRERLQARDDNTLEIVRKGESLSFGEWADFFLENYSKPPIRAVKTHPANKSAVKTLRNAFGTLPLIEVTPLQIEAHLRARLEDLKTVRRKEGIAKLPKAVKPKTVHQESEFCVEFSVWLSRRSCAA